MSASSRRRAVAEFLEGREAEVLGFARELIRTPSPNPPGDESAMADLVTGKLESLGIGDVSRLGAESNRPNLIAHITGRSPGRRLMLSGHLDTKPAGDMDAWKTDPWDPVVEDGQLTGLGSGDMKAALAGMIYAAGAIRSLGEFPGELALALTADEEAGSQLGSKWLAEEGHLSADVAVIGEPSGIHREWEAIHLISRGAALFKIKVSGTQMHSSISDRIKGVNATVEMAKLVQRMDEGLFDYLTFEDHPLCPTGPTVNVGVMAKAGVFYGVYPGQAEFACDLRTIPGMDEARLKADIQRFLDDAMSDEPDLDAELVWEIMVPATEISPEEPMVGALQRAATSVLGFEPALDAFPGATDAPHFQLTAGIPCVAAFGPGMLPRAHSPNEHMAAEGAFQSARIYALAAITYLEEQA